MNWDISIWVCSSSGESSNSGIGLWDYVSVSYSLYFGFALYFGFVGLGCFWGRFVCLMGASFVFWALGVMGAPFGFQVLRLILAGLFGFFPFVGWWFLRILSVYLGAPYAF
jgi:hypothetical protein